MYVSTKQLLTRYKRCLEKQEGRHITYDYALRRLLEKDEAEKADEAFSEAKAVEGEA